MSEPHGFVLTPLARVSARLVAYDWAWARDNKDAIRANWERRRAERPELFDGKVFLACGCAVRDGIGAVDLFETRYANFIAFRDAGSPDGSVFNAFAAIVPSTSDGAVLLGVMGAHTANACQIYFPCGTPDHDDLSGSRVDLVGSAAREFTEETGLSLPLDAEQAPWLLASGDGQLAFLRPVQFPETAQTLLDRIAAYHARDPKPELGGMIALWSLRDVDAARMPGFVRGYLQSI